MFHVEHCATFHAEQCTGSESARFEELHQIKSARRRAGFFSFLLKGAASTNVAPMGSRHFQDCIFWISGRSLAPIQRITCFAATFSECAHSRKGPNSPSAREHTKSSGATSSASSS